MVAFTPLCEPKPLIKFSGHPTTMYILNQHTSYTSPRTAVWCVSGAEHDVRSGGVEGYGPSRLELFVGGGRKKCEGENDGAKKTNFANAGQPPSFLRPWLLSPLSQVQNLTKTSGHSTTTMMGIFSLRLVVHPICRTTQDLAGSVRVWDWIGVGRVGWKAGVRCGLKILGLAWVELAAGWGLLLVLYRGM